SLLLSAALLLGLLSACRKSAPSVSPSQERTALELAELAYQYAGGDDTRSVEYLTPEDGEDILAAYVENAYGLEGPWEDAAVIRATGASAFEIAVLRMESSEDAAQAAAALKSYTFTREGDFAGYAPAEADMAANGSILQEGPFVALFICPDPDGARAAVEAALNGQSVPGPGPGNSAEPSTDVKKLRDFLVSDRGMDGAELERLDDSDPDALNAYMEDVYGLTPDQWEECAIARGTGDSAFEVAVVRVLESLRVLEDWNRISAVEGAFNDYLNAKEARFDSASEQAQMLHRAITITAEEYVVLLACEDAAWAAEAFSVEAGTMGYGYSSRYRFPHAAPQYPDRCKFTPPNEDDMSLYDTSAIRSAWEKGDPAGLSEYDREIYDQAKQVLDEVLQDGMSDYEKEVAVYSWIVQNVNYDWTHQDVMKKTPRESFTPYGGLVNHTAVCLGYAATFQLLMDLAGVECVTVVGAAHMSSSDHGWNMVRLKGNWYCVDVTWDANMREMTGYGRQENWGYFNVTSDWMADTDHQWDYANIPEAVTAGNGRD
ncbi:MAG: DUF4358 domain-containing protein, partial [Oscillospiraceae bacterium]|nr:DUF4358 domain-containing protein [Oscillospiraceae bacterium]